MCGISGVLSFRRDYEITHKFLETMSNTMIHRGPDGGNTWISNDRKIGLAHRRLSIIDLSTSAFQPMYNEDESVCISFNGEVYNFQDIKNEIKSVRNFNWKTDHSDTEVVLRAYETWGIECVHKFRGMFGLAIWDNKSEILWLVRDRMGIKPIYYHINGHRVVFASEIKALLTDSTIERKVNEEALYHYLSFITTPAPMTLFDGINKLENGEMLKISTRGDVERIKWYEIWDNVKPIKTENEDEISSQILATLRESVKLRKISDVPVGVFLSGGIDSSTNAMLFSEGETNPVKAFTIGYQGNYKSYQNETCYAKKMADLVKSEYHEKLLSVNDLIDFLPRMIHLQDEPIGDPVCVPVFYVSELAKKNGVTVCQVGEGADELFMGYPVWGLKRRLQKYANIPFSKPMQKILYSLANREKFRCFHEFEALRRSVNNQPVFWGGVDAFTDNSKKLLLSERLRNKYSEFTSWGALMPLWKRYQDKAWEKSILNWMSYVDLNLRLPELLLMRVDKMSMGVSLEARVPFLDHKFVELALGIPENIKIKGGLKYILKKAVRGVIPDEIIDRKKQGFGVPVYEWVMGKLGAQMKSDIFEFCKQTDYFDWKQINKLFETNQGSQLWYIYNFVLWYKTYIAKIG